MGLKSIILSPLKNQLPSKNSTTRPRRHWQLTRSTKRTSQTNPVKTIGERMSAVNPPPSPPPISVHTAVKPLSFLLGTWRGQGEGSFPTITPFKYTEELQFTHSPAKPVISYSSKTWKLSNGEPMHSESGYWRPKLDGTIEVVIAQSTGLAEVQKGTYDAERRIVKLKSTLVGNASKVQEIERMFELVNEELTYVVEMATNATSLQQHLKACLKKI